MADNERERLLLIARAIQIQKAKAAAPQTTSIEQAATGTNEGIAAMAGLPVDVATSGINWVTDKFGMAPIENPVGGSESIEGLLAPFMSDVDPQTGGQRLARRVGQEVGAGAVAGPVAGIGSLGGALLNTVSSAASGLAGGGAAEMGANPTVQMIASLLGGMAPVGASYAMRAGPQAPSNQQLRTRAGELYDRVEESGVALSPRQAQELQGNVSDAVWRAGMDPPSQGRATSAVNRVYDANAFTPDGTAPLMDVENARRFAGSNVMASNLTDDAEKRIGGTIRKEIDAYLDNLAGQPGATQAVTDLQDARSTSRRYLASETLDNATLRASRRAATSGSGGNEINTARQNIRSILDSEAKSAGFTAPELAQMDEIVMGTRGTNLARGLGGMSPTKGALPLMAGGATGAMAGTGLVTGNPIAVLAAAPSVIGYIAKTIGEELTDAQIRRLSATIRNGGPVAGKALSEGEMAVARALIARFASANGPEQ